MEPGAAAATTYGSTGGLEDFQSYENVIEKIIIPDWADLQKVFGVYFFMLFRLSNFRITTNESIMHAFSLSLEISKLSNRYNSWPRWKAYKKTTESIELHSKIAGKVRKSRHFNL